MWLNWKCSKMILSFVLADVGAFHLHRLESVFIGGSVLSLASRCWSLLSNYRGDKNHLIL